LAWPRKRYFKTRFLRTAVEKALNSRVWSLVDLRID